MSEQETIFWMCKITRCARAFNYSCCPIEMGYFYHMKLLEYPTNALQELSAIIIIMFVLD